MSELAERIRDAYTASSGQRLELHPELLDPGVEWRTNWPGLGPAVHGIDETLEFLSTFWEPWEEWRTEPLELIEPRPDTIFIHFRMTGRGRDGIDVAMDIF